MTPRHTRATTTARATAAAAAACVVLAACSTAAGTTGGSVAGTAYSSWDEVVADARGQEVALWMWGGDERGNAYVDDVLAPAAAERGVTLRRVPVADTADALNRVLSELQAGQRSGGAVDLVWVNGENFRTGQQAGAWACGWTDLLPNGEYLDPADPLLTQDFGTAVEGCESPWHKAQFVLAYDAADVEDPPGTVTELLAWAEANPGRFTYPAPPDFTGSAFLRQALYEVAGGPDGLPDAPGADGSDAALDDLSARLAEVGPSLWRGGDTYPRDVAALDELFAGDQVSFTMTYGPATLDALVEDGTFPADHPRAAPGARDAGQRELPRHPGQRLPPAGAMVVADLALSPEQQLAKADPSVWGQYTVLDLDRLPPDVQDGFAALPTSPVVPPFSVLSRDAGPGALRRLGGRARGRVAAGRPAPVLGEGRPEPVRGWSLPAVALTVVVLGGRDGHGRRAERRAAAPRGRTGAVPRGVGRAGGGPRRRRRPAG